LADPATKIITFNRSFSFSDLRSPPNLEVYMPVAVLNVRPSRQRTPELARVDARNKELALRSIGEKVVLYAPADEIRHGYFATARLVDVRPDMTQRRFMFIALADVNTFGRFISLDELTVPVESRAYRADGSRDFSYFSLSIRPLAEADRAVARSLEQQERAFSGFERSEERRVGKVWSSR